MAAFNANLAGVTERSFSSSLSPDRVVASSEDDNTAASALDPDFYKSLTDKRTTRGKHFRHGSVAVLLLMGLIDGLRRKSTQEARAQAQQQACIDQAPRVESSGTAVCCPS
jgi:hypothetical protein